MLQENMSFKELIEKTHQFPGPFTFKAIGKVDRGFAARVVAAVRDELGQSCDPPFRVRESVGGRHVSVTLEPYMESADQVIAVYGRIQKITGLVMLL